MSHHPDNDDRRIMLESALFFATIGFILLAFVFLSWAAVEGLIWLASWCFR